MIHDYFINVLVYELAFFSIATTCSIFLLMNITEKVYMRLQQLFCVKEELLGLSVHEITSMLHILYYKLWVDVKNKYCKTSESIAYIAICSDFEGYYLKQPTRFDFEKTIDYQLCLYAIVFLVCLHFRMHAIWMENCPIA